MNRPELEARLRDLCGGKTARVMELVDEHVAALSPGPSATRYRRGSVIRQGMQRGARRWRVQEVVGDDYLVHALFSDGAPMHAYWNVGLCEAVTELEWQNDEIGRIDKDGVCRAD